MIVSTWPTWFSEQFEGGTLPNNYIAFDIETTGFDKRYDVVTQIGHVLVQDREVVSSLEITVDWTDHDIVPAGFLSDRLHKVASSMLANSGKVYPVTIAKMKSEGVKPEKALPFYYDLLRCVIESGTFVAGHNILGFDEAFLGANFKSFLDAEIDFTLGNRVVDTQALAVADHLHNTKHPAAQPQKGETPRAYFTRVRRYSSSSKAKSNMAAQVAKCGLELTHGLNMSEQHSALFDATLVHHLMEHWRGLPLESNESYRPAVPALPIDPACPRQVPCVTRTQSRRRGQRNR